MIIHARPNKITPAIIFFIFIIGCAGTTANRVDDDPLKNTKKLIKEGHISLYENGAFNVPSTSIRLIPEGPDALQLAGELAGIRARQSLLLSLEKAADSVYIVSEGTRQSYRLSGEIHEGTSEISDNISKFSRENGKLLVYRSSELGKKIIGKSWEFSKDTAKDINAAGENLIESSFEAGDAVTGSGARFGGTISDGSVELARDISTGSSKRLDSALSFAKKEFILGYAVIPSKIKKRANRTADNLADLNFVKVIREENRLRKTVSNETSEIIGTAIDNYVPNIKSSFRHAGDELTGNSGTTTGLSVAALRSIGWVLQGLLWDAVIEPATTISAASIGYIGVNLFAFPAMVIIREGTSTTDLAIQVTRDTARTAYDLVAPTPVAAVAGIYGLLDYTGSNLLAGATAISGNIAGYGGQGIGSVGGVVIKGSGYAAGKGVQYIGVPLSAAGIAVGGGTIGVAAGTAGAVTGGALLAAGEAGALTSSAFGNIISGTTLIGGTTASLAGGTAYGIYQLSKAVIVPPGYAFGGGMVLSYGTLAHLGAQSVLAASDAAYMVLSLEGPRWVLYAVRGNLKGGDLPGGAIVDLKKMQKAGEEILYIPVSDEEMTNIVDSVYENLPAVPEEVSAEAE